MRFFNFYVAYMVQKYQNESAPIFYYGKSPKTSRKHLKIPYLQALTLGRVIKMTLYIFDIQTLLAKLIVFHEIPLGVDSRTENVIFALGHLDKNRIGSRYCPQVYNALHALYIPFKILYPLNDESKQTFEYFPTMKILCPKTGQMPGKSVNPEQH